MPAVSLQPSAFPDPGPDHRPTPAVRPRTPEEAQPARRALLKLSDVLLATTSYRAGADGRLAWLFSVLPLSTPEEIGDAIAFVARVLTRPLDGDADRAALFAMADLCRLVDDMRAEVEDLTDRRRSVTEDDGLTQLEREWDAVPVEDIEHLFKAAKMVDLTPDMVSGMDYASRVDVLRGAVARISSIRSASSRP